MCVCVWSAREFQRYSERACKFAKATSATHERPNVHHRQTILCRVFFLSTASVVPVCGDSDNQTQTSIEHAVQGTSNKHSITHINISKIIIITELLKSNRTANYYYYFYYHVFGAQAPSQSLFGDMHKNEALGAWAACCAR